MPSLFNDIVASLFICLYVTYTDNQRQIMDEVRQEVSRAGQEVSRAEQEVSQAGQDVGGMMPEEGRARQEVEGREEGQVVSDYELDFLIPIFLIWMSMEDAELPHPIQAVQDPQEGLEQYYQRLVCGHMC